MAGLFFAFSVSVMKALLASRRPRALPRCTPSTSPLSIRCFSRPSWNSGDLRPCDDRLALRWHDPGAVYLLIGGALYLVGTLLVTMVFNVPKNNALASVAPADPRVLAYGVITSQSGRPGTTFGRQRRSRQRHRSPLRSVIERRNSGLLDATPLMDRARRWRQVARICTEAVAVARELILERIL